VVLTRDAALGHGDILEDDCRCHQARTYIEQPLLVAGAENTEDTTHTSCYTVLVTETVITVGRRCLV